MDASDLHARVKELLDGGGGEPVPGASDRFLPLVTLDSDARCGLDGEARWLLVRAPDGPDAQAPGPEGGAVVRFAPPTAHLFHEVLEWKRRRFDDAVEEAARAAALPPEEALFSFPAVTVIRAVLEREHPYLTRLALEWIAPTELRELRPEILAQTKSASMPAPVRELAGRLLVPV